MRRAFTPSRVLVLVGGTALGILLLVLLFRSVDLGKLGAAFAHVDIRLLLLAVVPYLINLLLKVPRWALLFGEEAPDRDTLFGALTVGYAINALLPARLGEVVRAYWVRDRAGVGMVRTLSTIAVERVSDGLAVVVMVLLTAPTVAFPRSLLGPALTVGGAFVVALAVMVVLALNAARSHTFTRRLEGTRLAFVATALEGILAGLHVLRSGRAVALLVLYTAIIWGSNGILMWLVLRAFHLDIPLTAGVLATAVVNLGMSVPSTPGYIGIFEYLIVVVLGLFSVPHTPAVAAALGFHAIAFVPVTIVGLIYIVRRGVEVTAQMVQMSAEEREDELLPEG